MHEEFLMFLTLLYIVLWKLRPADFIWRLHSKLTDKHDLMRNSSLTKSGVLS